MKLRHIILPLVFSPFLFIPILVMTVLFVSAILFTSLSDMFGGHDTGFDFELGELSPLVLEYEPIVRNFAEQEGIAEYVPVLLAIMMQESGGRGHDPMQVSEYYCGRIGCISNPYQSIEQGVKYFKKLIEKANGDLFLAIQAYNFGSGFIDWVKARGGTYTPDLAIQFSKEMYQKEVQRGRGHLYSCAIGNAKELGSCYGDYLYVQHVVRYLSGNAVVVSGKFASPLPFLEVTSPYGMRRNPVTGQYAMHKGTDFSCNKKHIPVFAVADGVVEESMFGKSGSGFGGYGNVVLIKHDDSFYTLYAHLHNRLVNKGAKVKKGQTIGTCGSTGQSTGIHLHFEVRTSKHGGQIDPMTFLRRSG